jgi:DNA-directed RNA polymerase subunit RPC12/RpoP/transposase-like protein
MDEGACYRKLVELLHPDGLACPRCGQRQQLGVHSRHREPVLEYQCGDCGRVFNAWTGTTLQGTHRRPREILLVLHGVATGEPTAKMARALGCDRKHPLQSRHRLQDTALLRLDRNPLGDAVVEADEMYQDAGEKGIPHDDPEDPPRRRANGRRGHGTFANDRPPVAGVVGRESGEVRLEVLETAGGAELDEVVDKTCLEGAVVNTDEGSGYSRVGRRHGRVHRAGDHSGAKSGYAVDADGDGVREVHCNTMEGLWTGARNFLRPFRGVSKWYEDQYLAIFQWGHNLKQVTEGFLRALFGYSPSTNFVS